VLKIDMTQTGSDEWIESSLRFALRGLSEGLLARARVTRIDRDGINCQLH